MSDDSDTPAKPLKSRAPYVRDKPQACVRCGSDKGVERVHGAELCESCLANNIAPRYGGEDSGQQEKLRTQRLGGTKRAKRHERRKQDQKRADRIARDTKRAERLARAETPLRLIKSGQQQRQEAEGRKMTLDMAQARSLLRSALTSPGVTTDG
jgi:hypothetical protein